MSEYKERSDSALAKILLGIGGARDADAVSSYVSELEAGLAAANVRCDLSIKARKDVERELMELVAECDKWKTEYHRRIGKVERQIVEREKENDQLRVLLHELDIEWGWINVADRMPNRDVTVLLYAQGYLVGFYQDGQFVSESDHEILSGITHWQPLPESPVDYSDFVNCHEDKDEERLA